MDAIHLQSVNIADVNLFASSEVNQCSKLLSDFTTNSNFLTVLSTRNDENEDEQEEGDNEALVDYSLVNSSSQQVMMLQFDRASNTNVAASADNATQAINNLNININSATSANFANNLPFQTTEVPTYPGIYSSFFYTSLPFFI